MSSQRYGGSRPGRGGFSHRRGRRGGPPPASRPNYEEIAAALHSEFPLQTAVVESVLRDYKDKTLEQLRRLVKDRMYGMMPAQVDEYQALKPVYRNHLEHFEVNYCPESCLSPECVYFHKGRSTETRRKPVRLSNGVWNYLPIQCLEEGCSNSLCSFAHCEHEILYHPMTYKTRLCAYSLTPQQICTKYKHHCPFIHPELDSNGLPGFPYNRQNPSESLPSLLSLQDQIDHNEQMRQFTDTFVSLTDRRKNKIGEVKSSEPDNDSVFIRETYKVNPCTRFGCKRDEKCVDYHYLWEKRRANDGLYSYQPCGFVYDEGKQKFREESRCLAQETCQYAHTENEVFFHKHFFRKKPCLNFVKLASCPHPYCPFLHEKQANPRMPVSAAVPALPQVPPRPVSPPQPDISSALSDKSQSVQTNIARLREEIAKAEAELHSLEASSLCSSCRHQDFLYILHCGHTLCTSCAEQGIRLKLYCCRKCGKVSKTLIRLSE